MVFTVGKLSISLDRNHNMKDDKMCNIL